MALRFPARCKAQTSTTGTGTYTVAEPGQQGWRTFTQAVLDGDLANGDQVPCIVVDTTVTNSPNLLEIVVGTWNNTAKTLTRDTVYQPNAAAVNWGAGTRDVVVIDNPALLLLLTGGTLTGVLNILRGGAIIGPAAETGLLVQRSTTTGTASAIAVISGTSGVSAVYLGDTADEDAGGVKYDNSSNVLTFRTNATDGPKVTSGQVLQTGAGVSYDAFPTGTKLVFYQSSPPAGWTQDTSANDAALRMVSGAGGGTGGTRGLSSTTTGDHTLTTGELAAHTHSPLSPTTTFVGISPSGNGDIPAGTSVGSVATTAETGGSEPHNHPLALKYVDVVVGTKN